jgi:hypothetical protein
MKTLCLGKKKTAGFMIYRGNPHLWSVNLKY